MPFVHPERLPAPHGTVGKLRTRPAVVNVRSSLFVLAVGHIDGDETVPLVEAASRDVGLKRPQSEALRTDFLCEADERRPESTPRPQGSTYNWSTHPSARTSSATGR